MSTQAVDLQLRAQIEDLYAAYCKALDEGPLEAWPELFTEQCTYQLIPRENYAAGKPLATLSFESRGMLVDRVFGVRQTLFHQPYAQRHIVAGFQFGALADSRIAVEANYMVIRTKTDELSDVLSAGRCFDTVVREEGRLLFAVKRCVFDTELIANSLIYPI